MRFDPQSNQLPRDPAFAAARPDVAPGLRGGIKLLVTFVAGVTVLGGAWVWTMMEPGTKEAVAELVTFAPASAAAATEGGLDERLGEALAELSDAPGSLADVEDQAPERPAVDVLDQGRTYLAQGRHREAVPLLVEAVRLEPDNAQAHYKLGLAYVRTHDDEGAYRELSALRSLDPNLASLLDNLLR